MMPIARRSSACLKSKTTSPGLALFVLPLKDFFNVWMPDDSDSLVVIQKPFDNVWN